MPPAHHLHTLVTLPLHGSQLLICRVRTPAYIAAGHHIWWSFPYPPLGGAVGSLQLGPILDLVENANNLEKFSLALLGKFGAKVQKLKNILNELHDFWELLPVYHGTALQSTKFCQNCGILAGF